MWPTGDDDLQIMYGVAGERELVEHELDHLGGYANSRPVRVGNAAYAQHQHDVWGALLDSVYLHAKNADHLDGRIWPILSKQINAALKHWREPDAGIWEVRGPLRHFTSSKIMCWVALDRGRSWPPSSGRTLWRRSGRCMPTRSRPTSWHTASTSVVCSRQHYETTALDASSLLAPLLRFLPPDDPICRNTVIAIADELTVDGFVLRYKVDEIDDGFSGEEGSFTICSFWLVSALSEIGEHERARELCAKLLSFAGPLELYAEEIDPHTGHQLGNFPQAFTHLALINAVLHVISHESEEDALGDTLGPHPD